MKEYPTKFLFLSAIISFSVMVILAMMSFIPCCCSFRHEIINTAIICSTCICGISIIGFLIYVIHADNRNTRTDNNPTSEESELLLKGIKEAFSKEPKRICCRCNKISNSIVNVKVHKK